MDFVLLKVARLDWEKFRDLVEAEQQRSIPDKKSRAELAKDLITRAHLSRSNRHNDETFQVLLALVAQALTEISSGSLDHFSVSDLNELNPHKPKSVE